MRKRLRVFGMLLLLVASPIVASGGLVAAQSGDGAVTRDADLTIREPHYADGDVATENANGTQIYEVEGERILIQPAQFNASDVVEYGVAGDVGQLTYDADLGVYVFSPEGNQGSIPVYWTTREPFAANETVQQNGTNVTRTTTVYRQVRHQATLRVTGQTNISAVSDGALAQQRAAASRWNELNATLTDIKQDGLLLWEITGTDPSREQMVQAAINALVTTRDPPRLLQGSLRKFIIFMVLSIGGLFYIGVREGYAAFVWRKVQKELGVYKSNEDAEGSVSERALQLDLQERFRSAENHDWSDGLIDAEANAMRALGETPRQGTEALGNHILPLTWLADRLRAMGSVGYAARIDDVDDDGAVAEATLLDTRSPGTDGVPLTDGGVFDTSGGDDADETALESGDIIDLSDLDREDPDRDLVFALLDDAEREICHEFDLAAADFDDSALETTPLTYSLPQLLDELELQYDHFESMEAAGKAMHEWLDAINQTPYVDPDGQIRPARQTLGTFQASMEWLNTDTQLPQAGLLAEYIEAMLIAYDPTKEDAQLVRDIRDGKHEVLPE